MDAIDCAGYADALLPQTKLIYIETSSNPGLDIIDLKKVNQVCKGNNLLFVVDIFFATQVFQKPIDFGAGLVIHSTTKYLDGQGRTLGGIILGSISLISKIEAFARDSGPALSPFNAWVISKSIETLHVRMERNVSNAFEIAKRLEQNDQVKWVRYPFLESHPQYETAKNQMSGCGGIVSFEVIGGLEAGRNFLDRVNLFSLTAKLGDTRSIATHPASTTHSKLKLEERAQVGISGGLVHLSIGLEYIEDIWNDIERALDGVEKFEG